MLWSVKLVLERKIGKEIPVSLRLELLEKFSANRFTLSDTHWQHLQSVEQRRYSRFTFVENTISNSPNVPRAKFLGSDGLFCFSSTCKFDSFKNPFAMITSLPEPYFGFTRFILLVQTK